MKIKRDFRPSAKLKERQKALLKSAFNKGEARAAAMFLRNIEVKASVDSELKTL